MEKTETLSYKLEVFEGPLDLLLTLIAKNKLNIYDIPIALLLEQYMEQIERMQAEAAEEKAETAEEPAEEAVQEASAETENAEDTGSEEQAAE